MRYYLLTAAMAIVALIVVFMAVRILGTAIHNRRKYMFSDIKSALRLSSVRGKTYIVLFAFVMAVLVLLIMVEMDYQSGSVHVSLTYPEASEGLNPNGSRYNMSDILNDDVLEEAIRIGGFTGMDRKELKKTLSVRPVGRSDNAAEIVSTHFEIAYQASKGTVGYSSKEIVSAVAAAYRSWFADRYSINYQALNISFDDIQEYDYPDKQNYLGSTVQAIANFSSYFAAKDPTFYSEKTHESFNSIASKVWEIYDTTGERMNSYVLVNGLSRNHDDYLSRVRYNYTITSKYYRELMQAYDTRIAAIERYDEDMAAVVYIPTYDVDNVFYMSKTRIGVDYFSEEADAYSANAYEMLENLLDANYRIRQLRNKHSDQDAITTADQMIASLQNDILALANTAKNTARDYEASANNGYISVTHSPETIAPFVIAFGSGLMFLILAYLSMAMAAYKKNTLANKNGGAA